MTQAPTPPRRILAVLAPDSQAQPALEAARLLARAHGAALEVIACIEPPHELSIMARLSGADPGRMIAEATQRTRDAVAARLATAAPDTAPVEITVAVGKAYLEIIRHVMRTGCDFVVKTAEPLSGLDRFLFASTDQHLLRKCSVPVWLLTPDAPMPPRTVLAWVDLDVEDAAEPETLAALNRRAVRAACVIAGAVGAEVTVLHAWEAPGAGLVWAFSGNGDGHVTADRYVNEILEARHAAMDRFLAQMRTEIGDTPRLVPRLVRGTPEIVFHAQSRAGAADLVVMGTVARTGLGGVFIGNTAENIINSLECPVLAVKPEGFRSPLLRDEASGTA